MREVVPVEDEDRMIVPTEWRDAIHPRRGAVPEGISVPEHTGSTAAWDALLAKVPLDDVAQCIASKRTVPAVAEALAQFQAGQRTPIGAMAMLLLAERANPKTDSFAHVDAWITAHGLRFAASVLVEAGLFDAEFNRYYEDLYIHVNEYAGFPGNLAALLLHMRGYVAAASEDAYADLVELFGQRREELWQRVIVSYLLPTESKWLSEVCLRLGKARLTKNKWRPWVELTLCSVSDPVDLASLRTRAPFPAVSTVPGSIRTATAALGAAAIPLFAELLDGNKAVAATRRTALDALAHIPSDEAFTGLTSRLTAKFAQQYVMEAAERFPRRAIRLLAKQACAEDENARLGRSLLTTMLKQQPAEVIEDVRFVLGKDELELVDQVRKQLEGRPVAPDDALPDVLVNPPWTRKRPRRKAAEPDSEFEALRAPAISRVAWLPGEQEEFDLFDRANARGDWEAAFDEIEQKGACRNDYRAQKALLAAPEERAREVLPRLRATFEGSDQIAAWGCILVRFGVDALVPILHVPEGGGNLTNRGALLQPIVDPRVARLMADWLLRLKSARANARSWFARHREDAVTLLIPDALGSDKELRLAAEGALRYLAHSLGFDVVAVAEHVYGARAAAAVEEIIAVDRLELLPARMPKLPDWLLAAHLPQILLRDRSAALSEQATRHVLGMLAISKPGEPYAGLEAVEQVADPASLAAFAKALLAAWRAVDYPSDQGWILTAQGTFGDAEAVRRLVPLMVAWPRENGHHRAVAGLDVLVDVGDAAALFQVYRFATAEGLDATLEVEGDEPGLELDRLVQAKPRKALKEQARQRIARVAAERGLTLDQLADRLLPDLGLDPDGGLWLDYGPRHFRVAFDERLRPRLTDETGAPCPRLPELTDADDAELVEAARERLDALTEDVQSVVAHAALRLETSMALGHSWSVEEFRGLLHRSPVLWRIVRGLVWLSESEGATTAFRVAEDGGFADVEDDEFELPEQGVVRVAHPLQLGADLPAWAELFADYELLQPFAQLGRTIHALTDEERAGAPFTRFADVQVPIQEVRALLKRGWSVARSVRNGTHDCLTRPTLDGRWLFVRFDPGLNPDWEYEWLIKQDIEAVVLQDKPIADQPRLRSSTSLHDLDPITVSELVGDLSRMMN